MFISIVIPTYDRDGENMSFIEKSITSSLLQDYDKFEIIVSDHSKNDNVEKFCNGLGNDKIKFFKYVENLGKPAYNTNNGISKSSGDYIKLLNQDDYFNQTDILAKMVNLVLNGGWCLSGFIHFDNDKKIFYNPMIPQVKNDGKHLVDCVNTVGCPSVGLIPKDNFFDVEVCYAIDCDLWYNLFLKYGRPKILEEQGIVVRTGKHNLTTQWVSESKKMIEQDKTYMRKKYKI